MRQQTRKTIIGSVAEKTYHLEIRLLPGDSFDDACRRFKALFQRERVVGQLKEKAGYEKPSEKIRRKKREAVERKFIAESREKMLKSGELEKRAKRKAVKKQKRLEDRLRRQEAGDQPSW